MLNGGAVSWASRLQQTVALSSTEAEYMAACACTQEAVYLRQLLSDLGASSPGPIVIYEDNQGCIALGHNPIYHKRSKHIAIRYHFVRERIQSGDIKLSYLPTDQQLADLLTKPLPAPRTQLLTLKVLGQSPTPGRT
jgi:hypothetical protein